ncbi:MAG: zinc ribbon domain-containing protein [Planctomycetes bacterium]|nr:zinc ribbon domain-containing protein [Planctomycetota bacterium]
MPLREYKCQGCGEVAEFLERTSRKTAHICPKCGSKAMDKQFSTFASVVKETSSTPDRCQGCPSQCPHATH